MRIKRGEHSLNGSLSRLLIIDVSGITIRNCRDCFLVVPFDVLYLGVGGRRSLAGYAMAEAPRAADRATYDSGNQNEYARY